MSDVGVTDEEGAARQDEDGERGEVAHPVPAPDDVLNVGQVLVEAPDGAAQHGVGFSLVHHDGCHHGGV